jgi:hypothetical protein
MKPLAVTALVWAVVVPAGAVAASPWDGTWKARQSSMKTTGNPDRFELSNGMYSCESCAPPYKIKADGTDQPIPDHAYVDVEAVKVVSTSSVELTDKKAGKVTAWVAYTVSADGKTLNGKFKNYAAEKEVSGSFTETRLKAGPSGSHAISGSWQPQTTADINDAGLITTLATTAAGWKVASNGQTVDAKFDGKQYALMGDPGKTMMSFKKVDDNTIEETDRRLGKVTDNIRYSLAPDGKSISVVDDDPQHGTKTTYILDKQ